MKKKLLRYKNTDYELLVGEYKNGFIKVSMNNPKSKKIKDITIDGVDLVVPTPPTPNCAMVVDDKELMVILEKNNIIDNHYAIFGQFNINKLYEYDPSGVLAFVEKNASIITYRKDKGNSKEEVKKNIRKDAREVLNNPKIKKWMKDNYMGTSSFVFSILDNDNIKDSFAVFGEEDYIFRIYPYLAKLEHQFEAIPDYGYDVFTDFFGTLNENCEIIQVQKYANRGLIGILHGEYPDCEFKDGINKYFKYCKKKEIYKDEYLEKYKDIVDAIKGTKDPNTKEMER